MKENTVIFRDSRAQVEGQTLLGWYRFLQYADITSERPVACLLGTWDGNAPVEERLRLLTAQSSWLCSHTNGYASAMNFVDFIPA